MFWGHPETMRLHYIWLLRNRFMIKKPFDNKRPPPKKEKI